MRDASTVRVPQRGRFCGPRQVELRCPALFERSEGSAKRAAGRVFFGDFLLVEQKKVASRRATPGEVLLLVSEDG
jgi:hypothetical protein